MATFEDKMNFDDSISEQGSISDEVEELKNNDEKGRTEVIPNDLSNTIDKEIDSENSMEGSLSSESSNDDEWDVNREQTLQLSFHSDLDYEDLPTEETLENLLENTKSPYLTEPKSKPKTNFEDEDDEINDELNKLSAAEEDLRMELELLMSTGFHNDRTDDASVQSNQTTDTDTQSLTPSEFNDFYGSSDKTLATPATKNMAYSRLTTPTIKEDESFDMNTPTTGLKTTSDAFTPTMTNEDYIKLMKSRWKMQADDIGLGKFFVKDNRNSLRGCYTCPFLGQSTLEKLQIAKELTSTPHISKDETETLLSSNFEYLQPMPSQFLRQLYAGLVLPQSKQKQNVNNSMDESQSSVSQAQSQLESHVNNYEDLSEPLPLRTCGIRIRPDVLCGAVMDTLSHAVSERNGEIVKRQGGHMMAKIPGIWLQLKDRSFRHKINPNSDQGRKKKRKIWLPPFCFDAQLCTKKNDGIEGKKNLHERILLIRIYEMTLGNEKRRRHKSSRSHSILELNETSNAEYGKESNEKVKEKSSDKQDILRQAAYIVYQMEQVDEQEKQMHLVGNSKTPLAGENSQGALHGITSSKPSSTTHEKGVVSKIGNILTSPIRLLAHAAVETPNKISKKFIPALVANHNHLLQSAFRFLTLVVNEIETRELSYISLLRCRFGGFPALPTLDSQYCSQIRLLCRETMIMNLLETASGLEQYARDTERKCVEFTNMLNEGPIREYGMKYLSIPKIVPLTAYPLDFRPPEADNPPWGKKVKETLEKISTESNLMISDQDSALSPSKTSRNGTLQDEELKFESDHEGQIRADEAVKLLAEAFTQQFDMEQCARLARKNMQVMDRMAKMQALKRNSVLGISDCFGRNRPATTAAVQFHSRASKAKKPEKLNLGLFSSDSDHLETELPSDFAPNDQIPLLKCNVLIGGASGTCYVTYHQVLFMTQAIPIIGGIEYTLLNLSDIEFVLAENPQPSLLFKSPLNVLSVRMHREKISEARNNSLSWIIENTDEVLSFVPSFGSRRFIKFINMIKSVLSEDPETLKFSAKGGLIYMAEESYEGMSNDNDNIEQAAV